MLFDQPIMVDLNAICKRVLSRHSDDVEALNKSQLLSGRRSDGTNLPRYRKSYLKTRVKHGRPTAPMDLYLTGAMHKAIYSVFLSDKLELGTKDEKGELLENGFGEAIFGLDEKSIDTLLWQYGVADEIVTEFKNELLR